MSGEADQETFADNTISVEEMSDRSGEKQTRGIKRQ